MESSIFHLPATGLLPLMTTLWLCLPIASLLSISRGWLQIGPIMENRSTSTHKTAQSQRVSSVRIGRPGSDQWTQLFSHSVSV
jgi:hypothetical protein